MQFRINTLSTSVETPWFVGRFWSAGSSGAVSGIVGGRPVVADGTPRRDGELLVKLNPLYSFVGAG